MRKEKIPDFFTADMWKKYVSIWFLPLLLFLMAMYITAFTKGSLVFIIFSFFRIRRGVFMCSIKYYRRDYFRGIGNTPHILQHCAT